MKRREYKARLKVNGRDIRQIVIDPHYELKHLRTISDDIVLDLVQSLSGHFFEPMAKAKGFEYFVEDGMELRGKSYKLIWLLQEGEAYLGVINCYRRR